MFKKSLSICLLFLFFTAVLHAQTSINLQLGSQEITATKINGQEKYLIDSIYYINEGDNKDISKTLIDGIDRVDIVRKTNQAGSNLFIGPDKVTVTCREDFVTWLDEGILKDPYKTLYVQFTENIDGDSSNTIQYYLQVKCRIKSDEQLRENPIDIFDIKEKDVYVNNNLSNFSISSKYSEIPSEEAEDKLMKPYPSLQPKFIEIIYYQIITIDKLTKSLQSLGIDIDNLFVNNFDFIYYNQWLKIFSEYNNVQSFADDFDHPITLKDIGIADSIAKSLSARLLCEYKALGACSKKIDIVKTTQFEFYTLKEILDSIYVGTNSTSSNMESLYEEIKELKDKEFDEISNPAEKSFVSKVMKDTFENMIGYEDFAIGYGLQTRINDINSLKSTFMDPNNEKKINIRGIYNFYYELANISKGYNKSIALEKAIGEDSLETIIKKTALEDIKNKLSLLGDESALIDNNHDILTGNIIDDLQNLLRINEEDFTISLIGCTKGTAIGDFLNYDNIKTEFDYYNLLEGLISKAYSSTNRKMKESPDDLYSEGLYYIEGKNNISIYLSDIEENTGFNSTFGYYFANSDRKPIYGKVLIENTNDLPSSKTIGLSIISNEIPSDASYIGFWFGADAYNSSIKNGDKITFESVGLLSSSYRGKINDNIVETAESNNSIYFSVLAEERMRKDGNIIQWEDNDDESFDDLVFKSNVLIADYYSVYLNMPALKDTIYDKYFNITECYNTVNDDNLILYYDGNGIMGDYIDDYSLKENNGNGKDIRGENYSLPMDIEDSLYFSQNIIQTNERSIGGNERTIEIKFKASNTENLQILYDEGSAIHGINIFIKDGYINSGIWGTENISATPDDYYLNAPYEDSYNTFISKNIDINRWYTIKVILDTDTTGIENNSFKVYLGIENGNLELIGQGNASKLGFDRAPFPRGTATMNIGANDLTRYCISNECILCKTCSSKVKPFYGIMEYIKIWDIAKYPEDDETTCNTVQTYTMDTHNTLWVARAIGTIEKIKTISPILEAGTYKIKLKVERSADQFEEKFDFYGEDINGNQIKIGDTSMDHPDEACHNNPDSSACLDEIKNDCHANIERDRDNAELNGCRETITENITFSKSIKAFTMKYPNPDGARDSSSHIMEIIVERCE